MNVYTVGNCKNCEHLKCVLRCDYDFDLCPVEVAKEKAYPMEVVIPPISNKEG